MRIVPERQHHGFTLPELMMVFAVIGVLMSFGLPHYQRYTFRAKAAGVVVEAESIKRDVELREPFVVRGAVR